MTASEMLQTHPMAYTPTHSDQVVFTLMNIHAGVPVESKIAYLAKGKFVHSVEFTDDMPLFEVRRRVQEAENYLKEQV